MQLCLIVCDCMVHPDPNFLIFETKNSLIYFSDDGGLFFGSYVTTQGIATISLKQTFEWYVWFDGQIVYIKIEHLSNINEIYKISGTFLSKGYQV